MSLINDALKRAREAQQQAPTPPSPPLQFRPVEPAPHARHGLGLMVPAVLAVVALLALFLVWQLTRNRGATPPREVRAHAPAVVTTTTTPPPASTLVTAQAQASPQATSPRSPVSSAADTPAPDKSSAPDSPPLANPQTSEATNTSAIAPAPPKPAPLRLQAIVFNPKRPSALISGKTLFIGDKLGALRVVAIDQNSATLVGAGQTNVLSLAE